MVATNAEQASGFVDLADCQKAIGGGPVKAGSNERAAQAGSAFNRAAGNLTRCELVKGEILVVVYPGAARKAAAD